MERHSWDPRTTNTSFYINLHKIVPIRVYVCGVISIMASLEQNEIRKLDREWMKVSQPMSRCLQLCASARTQNHCIICIERKLRYEPIKIVEWEKYERNNLTFVVYR